MDASIWRRTARQEYADRASGASTNHTGTWTSVTMHCLLNCLIELDDDMARSETYCVAYHRTDLPDDELPLPVVAATGPTPSGERDIVVGCRYIDRFARRDQVWRIAHRVLVIEWTRVDPVSASWASEQFPRGRRDHDDLVYAGRSATPSR